MVIYPSSKRNFDLLSMRFEGSPFLSVVDDKFVTTDMIVTLLFSLVFFGLNEMMNDYLYEFVSLKLFS